MSGSLQWLAKRQRWLLPLILAALYLLTLALGIGILLAAFLYSPSEHNLRSFSEHVAQNYLEGRIDDIQAMSGPSNANDLARLSRAAELYAAAVFQGKQVYRPALLDVPGALLPMIVSVDGTPIRSDRTICAVFTIQAQPHLSEALVFFACFYTVFFWGIAGGVLAVVHRMRKINAAQRNYIANVTHSLKSPIASVRSVTETLSDVPDLDEDRRMGYYGIILQEMNTLNPLVGQMLELSRQQSGEIHYEMTAASFEEVFGPTIEKYRMICECTQVSLIVSDDLNALPPLCTNPEAAGSILEILLENAVKYTQAGNAIQISAAANRRKVTICVKNNGGSIPPEDVPHVFERFDQGKNSTFSGLGLAIARETAENLGETIWVRCSQPDETMFFFTVPISHGKLER